jgi:GT2 family glycosyltransferase
MGARIVELDTSRAFSAARARNEGWRHLLETTPEVGFVQFVDGDCEVVDGWIAGAREFLERAPEHVVVCGRRREIFPEASIYNRLCDLEWDTPVGDARSCGGDSMMSVPALAAVGGFDPRVVAGEEPELCFRLRSEGGRVRRLDLEMTGHDAAMSRFGQWWRRAVRAGHAYAQAAALHGRSPERFGVRPSLSILFWALGLPVIAAGFIWFTGGWSLALLLLIPLQVLRVFGAQRRRGRSKRDAKLYAIFCVLAKWPQLIGQMLYLTRRIRGREERIIEYKKGDS